MAAPLGNKNAAKAREWTDALKWVLLNYEGGAVAKGQALREIATKCVVDALEGDKDARTEIAVRLDGKPVQPVEGTGDDGEFIVKIIRFGD